MCLCVRMRVCIHIDCCVHVYGCVLDARACMVQHVCVSVCVVMRASPCAFVCTRARRSTEAHIRVNHIRALLRSRVCTQTHGRNHTHPIRLRKPSRTHTPDGRRGVPMSPRHGSLRARREGHIPGGGGG